MVSGKLPTGSDGDKSRTANTTKLMTIRVKMPDRMRRIIYPVTILPSKNYLLKIGRGQDIDLAPVSYYIECCGLLSA
jgi:hypothetical protein